MDTDPTSLSRVPLVEIEQARERLQGRVVRTPLLPLDWEDPEGSEIKIWLKMENLQHTGSFKLRGACNAIRCLPDEALKQGVYTSSAGNFAQGLAWNAKQMGIPCTIIVPDTAPKAKVDAMKRYGGQVISMDYASWWQVMKSHQYDGATGQFVHPSCDRNVIAGNGTIGLEILEDLPEVDTIVSPYGGGGLSTGIASAIKTLKPEVKMVVCELETAAPVTVSLEAGKPSQVENHKPSFVDGMGGKNMFPEMWNLVKNLIDSTVVLSLQEVANTVGFLLQRARIMAEGAGAAPVAAVTGGHVTGKNVVCIISGGNIDSTKVVDILQGNIPT